MRFECRYCPATFPDFWGLAEHFEAEHRNDEHIVLEFPADRGGEPIIEEGEEWTASTT